MELLPKSTPNLLESMSFDGRVDKSPPLPQCRVKCLTTSPRRRMTSRSRNPLFCETLQRHPFMQDVIPQREVNRQHSANGRKSLEEISQDIKELDHLITLTEMIIRQEDTKNTEKPKGSRSQGLSQRKKWKKESPSTRIPKDIEGHQNTSKTPKDKDLGIAGNKFPTTKQLHSRLYFRNGYIGCEDAENSTTNIESTHAFVKQILKYEHEKPLVSPGSVRRILYPGGARGDRESDDLKNSQICEEIETNPSKDIDQDIEGQNQSKNLEKNEQNQRRRNRFSLDLQELKTIEEPDSVQICYNELPEVLNEEQNLANLTSIQNVGSPPEPELLLVEHLNGEGKKSKTHLNLPPLTPSSGIPTPILTVTSPPEIATPSTPPMAPSNGSQSPTPCKVPFNSPLLNQLTMQLSPRKLLRKADIFEADTPRSGVWLCSSLCGSSNDHHTLDPQGHIYIAWLCVVSVSFLYNAWVIPLRSTFPFQTPENTSLWLTLDFLADCIYLIDVVFFKHRIMYLFEGFWVKDKNLTRKNYMRKFQFKLDLLSLLPLELLYFRYGTKAVYLRFPRFLKVQSFWEFFRLLDRVISSPHIVRIGKTLLYMLYMIHLTATFYYGYSDYQGLGVNRWVFSGKGHPYVRCFAFATKTATSIGKNPKPEREGEYVFMTIAWLMGVFVFALLIGQIRDIISTATRTKNEYRQLEDETLEYMRHMNLPQKLQKRVKMWFKFTWDQQRTLDESNILDALPNNLKTDIAIAVHIQTLSKVQLFADCEEALLRDLVLKLRAVTFLPGDYVCRKGEVGREMYIIKLGQVQVMGGPDHDTVLATLTEGSVFGEISLLGINGADRRTADVRSNGYANLFVLSKDDLNEVIVHYPNAQAILKRRARAIIQKNAIREQEERKRPQRRRPLKLQRSVFDQPPNILESVLRALPDQSPAVLLVTRGGIQHHQSNSRSLTPSDTDQGPGTRTKAKSDGLKLSSMKRIPVTDEDLRPESPDLLSSIQSELQTKHQYLNLTDSQKALIISSSPTSNDSLPGEE